MQWRGWPLKHSLPHIYYGAEFGWSMPNWTVHIKSFLGMLPSTSLLLLYGYISLYVCDRKNQSDSVVFVTHRTVEYGFIVCEWQKASITSVSVSGRRRRTIHQPRSSVTLRRSAWRVGCRTRWSSCAVPSTVECESAAASRTRRTSAAASACSDSWTGCAPGARPVACRCLTPPSTPSTRASSPASSPTCRSPPSVRKVNLLSTDRL